MPEKALPAPFSCLTLLFFALFFVLFFVVFFVLFFALQSSFIPMTIPSPSSWTIWKPFFL